MKKLLLLSNLTFLSLFVIVVWHNRPAGDDFCFLYNTHTYGIVRGAISEYNSWCTRYTSLLCSDFVLNFVQYKYTLFLFGIVEITAFVLSLAFLLKAVFSHFFNYALTGTDLLNVSLLFTNGLFYTTPGISETWFWVSAVPTYIFSIICFFLACGMLLHKNSKPLIRYTVIALSFIYMGGSSEIFAAFILFCMLVVYTGLLLNKQKENKTFVPGLSVALLFGLAALVLLIIGKGNTLRQHYTHHISLFAAFALNFKMTGIVAVKRFLRVLPLTLLFSVPFAYIGNIVSVKNKTAPKSTPVIFKQLVKFAGLWVAFVFIQNYPITYLLDDIGPDRALVFTALYSFLFFAGSFFYIGLYLPAAVIKKAWMVLPLCIVLNSYNAVTQFFITSEYAKKYDERMKMLDTMKQKTGTIELEPLPAAGMLFSADKEMQFLQEEKGLKATVTLKTN